MATNSRNKTGEELTAEVQEKIAQFSDKNKPHAVRMHQLIMEANPSLQPRLWYGMPGYAMTKDSAVLVFFREDAYMTFGFTEAIPFAADRDSGTQLMPCAWFFTDLDEATERKIVSIIKHLF
jgi:hypothetical protein